MDGDVILDELSRQLSSSDPTVRAKAYKTSLSKLKTLNLNTKSLEPLFCKMEGASLADLIRDIQSDQTELASAAATFLSIRLRADSSTMKLEVGRDVIASICDAISKTAERTVCEKLMSCFSAQSFTPEVVTDQLDKILGSLETGQCQKHFNSHTIELEAVVVITRLLEQVPTAMEAHVTRWAHLVYPLVIHKKSVIRNQANLAFKLGLNAFKGNAVVAKQLLDDLKPGLVNAFIFLMKNQQETYALAVWSSYVEILGPLLHRGSSINCLLPIVEMGFKNTNLEVKICAYKAWQAIIDNFALCEEIISDSKRIKLILKVFLTCNVKSEGLAMEKFRVWWHFVRCLGGRCVPWFEQVVVPMLQFSLHGKYVVSSSETKPSVVGKKASPSITTSPGLNTSGLGVSAEETSQFLSTMYRPLLQKGCETLMMILAKGCDHCVSENAFSSYTADRLEHDVLGKGLQAAKHLPFLISCAKNCFLSGVIQNDEEVSLLWSLVVNHVKSLLETSDVALKQERQNALEALLDTLSIATEAQIFSAEQNLSMIDEVMSLPSKVLSSSSYHIGNTTEVMKGCPCLYLTELLFRSKTLERCAATKRFHNTLERVILAGFHNSSGILSFCHSACEMLTKHIQESVMTCDDMDLTINGIKPLEDDLNGISGPLREELKSGQVEKNVKPDETCYLSVWSSIASHLHDQILKSNEVNQGNNLEHDFSCMHTILMFPMHVIGGSVQQHTVKSVTKLWTSIYATFFRLSSMVQNAGPNVACEEFCEQLLTLLQQKSQEDRELFDFICQCAVTIASTADMSGVYSGTSAFGLNSPTSSYQIMCKRKGRQLGNLHSLTKLVEVLLNSLYHHVETESLTQQSLLAVIQITESLFHKRPPASFLLSTLRLLTRPLARLYQLPPAAQNKLLTLQTTSKLDQLWSVIGICIQTCHAGAYDSDLLELLSPLLAATFSHSRRFIKNHTLKLWNATFGSSSKTLSYPDVLRCVLSKVKDRSSIVLPGWHWDELTAAVNAEQSIVDIELSQMDQPQVPPIALKISPRKPANSCNSVKSVTPAAQSLSKSTPSPRAPSTRRASKNVQLSIFDDKSEDYVTIAPKPASAKKVLTEHQKEVFQSRSNLPAMYSNLDASVDISLSEFQSDSHADNTTSSGSHEGPAAKAEDQDQQKMDTGDVALAVDESNVITDPTSASDRSDPSTSKSASDPDPSVSKAPGDGEDVGQDRDCLIVCETHESGSSQSKQELPDCCVCLVRLPDFLLSQESNESSESLINKVTDAYGCASLVRDGGDSSSAKDTLATKTDTVGEKSDLEIVEKPTGNVTANADLLICENTETELPHTDVTGDSVVHHSRDVILVEDSQMPSCASGKEDEPTTTDPAIDSEMCIMDTPEKDDQFTFRLFSDKDLGPVGSAEKPRASVSLESNIDDFEMETSLVTVVPDSCAIESDHLTVCGKNSTPCHSSLTVVVETEPVVDVRLDDSVAMETEEMSDSLLSRSSTLQNTDNVESEISASSMNLRLSEVESIADPDCLLTPISKSAVQLRLGSSKDSLSGAELNERRSSGEIGEGDNSLVDDSPAAAASASDNEDHLPLATFMKRRPLGRGTRKQPTERQRMTTADQEIAATDQQIPATEQQIAADATRSEERQPSRMEQQTPTDVQEIQELSSQTQDLPPETCTSSLPPLESEMQSSLTEMPSAQPLQTQREESEHRASQSTELSPSVPLVTQQIQSDEKQNLISDVTSPEPVFNVSTSSEDDIPLGRLARKISNVLSDKSQTYLKVDADAYSKVDTDAYLKVDADAYLKVDADASSVLSMLGETQSKLVTKLRSRGRAKRSPYSSLSTGLTLRSRSLGRAETDDVLQMLENNKSSGQRRGRKISLTISVENPEVQGKQVDGENERDVEIVEDVGKMDVTSEARKEDKEPEQCRRDETDNQTESAEDVAKDEVDKEKREPGKLDCVRPKEKVEEKRNETAELKVIEGEGDEKNCDARRIDELEERHDKCDTEKTQSEDSKEENVAIDDTAACKPSVESKNYFTQICDPKSTKNCSSNKIVQLVISDEDGDAATSDNIITVETDDAVSNASDTKSIEAVHSADDASKRAAVTVSKGDVAKGSSAAAASLFRPAVISNASPGSLRKSRMSEIPLTPTSGSTHRVLSRGHLMLSRSKQLFAMPNSGKLKTTPGGTDSPKSFVLSVAAESVRTRSQGSPLVLPVHVFSPSASPSAGILRKKRLREETPSVDSPSPPHKHRRVCFSDKVDTIEIPNRFQQRRQQTPVAAKDSPTMMSSGPGKQINRQLEMNNTPPSSVSSAVISSKSQNLQKSSAAGESSEAKDCDLTKPDVILQEMYSMDCEPSDNAQVLTMTQESQLNCSEPVFPELINCTAPVDQILPKLTTTTWMIGLRQLLHAKNIKTIGNLSSLSELEVHNLPIVQPKVDNLKESLQAFARSNKMSLTDDGANKKCKLDALATEQESCVASLQDKVVGSSPDSSAALRRCDNTDHDSSDTKQISNFLPDGDADSVPSAETDTISGITPVMQPLENISSETAIGEGNTQDHEDQLSDVSCVELEGPSVVQMAEEQAAVRVAEYEETLNRLLNHEISNEQALRLLDLSVKLSMKCSQIVTNGINSGRSK